MEEEIIVKMKFGSHLYGTDTPESDTDIKGIFLPSKRQIYLGQIPKSYNMSTGGETSKNTKKDIDTEIFSLHYFIKLACEGQTIAMDMLHAPETMILEGSEIWDELITNREKFYTKKLTAFIGYARKQAAKYGIKGSRLSETKQVLDLLNEWPDENKIAEIWNLLPVGEHLFFLEKDKNGIDQYQVCGRTIQKTVTIKYAKSIVKKFYDNYGARAMLASENKNIDWKAISHAIRAATQIKELLIKNTITLPLPNADFIKMIKLGKFDYLTVVAPILEKSMSDIEILSKKSTLPEKVNQKFWDDFIIDMIEYHYSLF